MRDVALLAMLQRKDFQPHSVISHEVTSTIDVAAVFGAPWTKGNTLSNITETISKLGDCSTGISFGSRGSALMNTSELSGYKDFWFINTKKK